MFMESMFGIASTLLQFDDLRTHAGVARMTSTRRHEKWTLVTAMHREAQGRHDANRSRTRGPASGTARHSSTTGTKKERNL